MKLRECFESLDDDNSGAIGLTELIDPMIGLGFADDIHQVRKLIEVVDKDDNCRIDFPEFLTIIRQGDQSEKTKRVTQFFKDLTTGKYGNQAVSFPLFVCGERRKHLKNAIYSTGQQKEEGLRIMGNIK